jgi:REP element-mobilizing transposase RayT
MSTRKTPLVTKELYHVYNRGVEKRDVFLNQDDLNRFFSSIIEFNSQKPIGSLHERSFVKKEGEPGEKLVSIVAYCLNPNHFHLILQQEMDGGISEFMKRLGGGYTGYFNEKNKRSGALFQGKYKSKHVDSDNYLKHLSAYINLNSKLGGPTPKLYRSSWDEYVGDSKEYVCKKDPVLGQFKNKEEYKKFCEESLKDIIGRKKDLEWEDYKKLGDLGVGPPSGK